MARARKRLAIQLIEEQKQELEKTSRSRTAPAREVERAAIILRYNAKESISSIKKLGVSRLTIYKCIDKAIAAGPERKLKDMPHSPKKHEITEEAKVWFVSLACTKPKVHGYAAEVWSQRQLAEHARKFVSMLGISVCQSIKGYHQSNIKGANPPSAYPKNDFWH